MMKKSIGLRLLRTIGIMTLIMFICPYKAEAAELNNKSVISLNGDNVEVSAPMTESQAATKLARDKGVSYFEAYRTLFGENIAVNSINSIRRARTIRVLSVTLDVLSYYHPRLEFYCETSQCGNWWGIKSIYDTELVRQYGNTCYLFSGSVKSWLINEYQIQYVINGDFYKTGKQTSTVNAGGKAGLGDTFEVNFGVSVTSSEDYLKYYYKQDVIAYQH